MAFVLLAVPAFAGAIYTGVQAQKILRNTYYHPSMKSIKPVIRKHEPNWSEFKTMTFGSPETYYDKLTGAKSLWPTVVEPLYYFVGNHEQLDMIMGYVSRMLDSGKPGSFEAFMTYIMEGNHMTASTLVNIQEIYKAVEKLISINNIVVATTIREFVKMLDNPNSIYRTN